MKRRNFLKTSLIGWGIPQLIIGGKNIFLWNYVEHALYSQVEPSRQSENDCVAHAAGLGVEFVQAIQHFLNGDVWHGRISTEILHAGTLLKVSSKMRGWTQRRWFPRPRPQPRKVNPFDGGTTIKESITFLKEYGNLFRRVYGDYDFTKYDYANCDRLLKEGVPDNLLDECKKHPVQTASLVKTWEKARDAIFNLQPVIIGSDVGFSGAVRDRDGFAKPSNKKWYHAWLLIGITDRGRKGGCLMSSHGKNWVAGPKSYDQPDGSIWVDKEVLQKMVSKYGDSYAISNFIA